MIFGLGKNNSVKMTTKEMKVENLYGNRNKVTKLYGPWLPTIKIADVDKHKHNLIIVVYFLFFGLYATIIIRFTIYT